MPKHTQMQLFLLTSLLLTAFTLTSFITISGLEHPRAVNEFFTFMHDSCSVHTAQYTRETLHLMGINVMKNWPAHSPELNPIENVWAWMARKISRHAPTTRDELVKLIIQYWNAITVTMRRALFASVPIRLLQVLVLTYK
jgi:hypothetical protein